MSEALILEWKFSPPDYFEEIIQIKHDTYQMTIAEGKAEARVDPSAYDKDPVMREMLHDRLNDRFLGVQLLTHKPYTLSKPSMSRLHPDGRKDVTIFSEPCVMTMTMGTVDIVITDKDGKMVSDTKKDRTDKKKQIADLAEKYRAKDPLVASLLVSYHAAVNDPDNELVHLYEIRDALASKFGGETSSRKALNISAAQWSKFGQLANDAPVRQGRHRGKKVGELRDATKSELEEARDIAFGLVEGYLEYLKKLCK